MFKRPLKSNGPKQLASFDKKLCQYVGKQAVRAYKESGEKIGSKENKQGRIYLNTQSWGVISGHADAKRLNRP
jgi:cellobiose phosphorylase